MSNISSEHGYAIVSDEGHVVNITSDGNWAFETELRIATLFEFEADALDFIKDNRLQNCKTSYTKISFMIRMKN